MARKYDDWGDEIAGAPWARLVGPAPGDLRIVQAFANTKDLATGGEEFSNPTALRDWLARWRLLAPGTKLGEIPDLFDVEPLVIHARYAQAGSGTVTIRGISGGRHIERELRPGESRAAEEVRELMATIISGTGRQGTEGGAA